MLQRAERIVVVVGLGSIIFGGVVLAIKHEDARREAEQQRVEQWRQAHEAEWHGWKDKLANETPIERDARRVGMFGRWWDNLDWWTRERK